MKVRNVIIAGIIAVIAFVASNYNSMPLGLCQGWLKDSVPTYKDLEGEPVMFEPKSTRRHEDHLVKFTDRIIKNGKTYLLAIGEREVFWMAEEGVAAFGPCDYRFSIELASSVFEVSAINRFYDDYAE